MEVSNLYELGSQLKAHREKCGLEREDIALRIKISAKNLHAIEEGLLDKLPQPVFTKSFIRSYAQAMDMDMEEINRRIEEVFPSTVIDNVKHDLTPSAREQSVGINSSPVNGRKIGIAAGIIVVLLALAFGGWMYFGNSSSTGQNGPYPSELGTPQGGNPGEPGGAGETGGSGADGAPQSSAGGASESAPAATAAGGRSGASSSQPTAASGTADGARAGAAQTASATGQAGSQSSAAAATGGVRDAATAQPASGQTAQTAQPGQSSQSGQPAQQATQTAQAGQSAQGTQAGAQPGRITPSNTVAQSNASAAEPLPTGRHRVIVSATSGECWVGAKFDEIGERNVRLVGGRHFVLEFRDRLTLTLGNAGVVKVSYNGRPVNFTAADGDVRILRFPPNSR